MGGRSGQSGRCQPPNPVSVLTVVLLVSLSCQQALGSASADTARSSGSAAHAAQQLSTDAAQATAPAAAAVQAPGSHQPVHQPTAPSTSSQPQLRQGHAPVDQPQQKQQPQYEQPTTAHQPGPRGSPPRPRVPLLAVTLMSAAMSLMSCLGVLPYFFCARLSRPWAGVANAVASGVMLAASFGLLAEGAPYGGTYLITGMLLGVVFVKLSQEHLEQYEVDSFEQLAGADARKVILFLAVMAVHAVGEGGGVGVSFAGDRGWAQGTLVTLAIGLHNIPEGLAVATVMAAKGTSPRRTLLWTALTALPQALVAPPAYAFVETFRALLPLAMGFAAGCMIWVVLAELLPDALEAVDAERVATCATGSAAWLQGLSIWIAHLETPAGTLASPFGDYQAVLPLGLAPLLPQLLPAVIAPALLAWAAAGLVLPLPLLAAASGGLLAAYAGSCWLQLLLSSPHRLLSALLAPAVGAGVAAALWRQLRAWQLQPQPMPRLSRPGSDAAAHVFDAGAAEAVLAAGSTAQQQQQGGSPGSDHSCNDANVTVLPGTHVLPRLGSQQQQQQGLAAAAHGGHVHARHGHSSDPSGADLVAAAAAATAAGAPNGGSAWDQQSGSSTSSSTPRHAATGHPLLPGRGELLLPVAWSGGQGNGQQQQLKGLSALLAQQDGWGSGLSSSSGALKGHSSLSCHSSSPQAVAAVSMLALGGAAAAGLPLGLQLAAALTADPSSVGHVVVPLLLLGCLLSLGALGFCLPLLGARRVHVGCAAGLVACMPAAAAVAALLSQPAWVHQGSARSAADSLQGLTAGFSGHVLLLLLLPLVRRWGAAHAATETAWWGGVGAGAVLCLGLAGLCTATPYCLHATRLVASASSPGSSSGSLSA